MANTHYLATDILIIGGGSAGCMAAIRAKEVAPELAVTIFEKGDIRRGGTLAMGMDALNVVVVPGVTSEDDYLAAVHLLAEGIYDAAPRALACPTRATSSARSTSRATRATATPWPSAPARN